MTDYAIQRLIGLALIWLALLTFTVAGWSRMCRRRPRVTQRALDVAADDWAEVRERAHLAAREKELLS